MALIERWITVCPTHGPARIAMPTKPEQGCWVWLNDDVHCREEVEYVLLTNAQEAVDLDDATDRVEAMMVRVFGAARGEETRGQALRLARAALGRSRG